MPGKLIRFGKKIGWNDHMDDSDDISNLPPEAIGNVFDLHGPFEPNDDWLRSAGEEYQLIAIRAWFRARYWDPAHETPYNSREGGISSLTAGHTTRPLSCTRDLAASLRIR